ncbi:MAG: right-handed parallel beta-helix repeat-containing protein [Lachnospiraceae bacterium]|nr:right-handed parallel beta-helix repeat-containing protein [Lachnospiraceae bacterium]
MRRNRFFAGLTAVLAGTLMTAFVFTAPVFGADAEKEKEPQDAVFVENEEELFAAFADDTTIVLAPGVYNVTDYMDSLKEPDMWAANEVSESGMYVNPESDGPELVIYGYRNLTLVSADRESPAEIVCEPRYADVLSFVNCEDVLLDGLTVGHTKEPGFCTGEVLCFDNCEDIIVSKCDLYGCGTYAFSLYQVQALTAIGCEIHDCTYGCITSVQSDELRFIRCDFHDCKEFTLFDCYGGKTDFIACDFRDLTGELLQEGAEYTFIGCTFDEKVREELEKGGYLKNTGGAEEDDTKEEDGLIRFTALDNPITLRDEAVELARGDYWTLTPDEDAKEAYPALSETLEKLNREEKKAVTEAVADMEEDSRYMNETTSYAMCFERSKSFIPLRADEKAFSYVYWVYEYMGGVHGYSYPLGKTIDPKTGRDIALTDIVKDFDALEEAMIPELLAQNEDLPEYFEEAEGLLDSLKEDNKERLKNDGEALCFAVGYEGLWIFYEDYAMGSYVAGAREEVIRFADYPEVFTDAWQPEKGGKTPDINEQATIKTGRTETLKSKEHAIHTIPLSYHYESFLPEKKTGGDFDLMTYAEEYKADEEAYPALAGALQSFNESSESIAERAADNLLEDAKKLFEEEKRKDFPLYTAGFRLSLRRADDRITSFVAYEENETIVPAGCVALGKNLYTETGEDIELCDVITDTDMLVAAAGDQLKKIYTDEELRASVLYTLQELVDGDGGAVPPLVSSPEFSWCIGYRGLDLYLNPEVNYNFYGDFEGPVRLFISFAAYPELFTEAVKAVPGAYVYDLEITRYPEKAYVDTDEDGAPDEVSVILTKNSDEWFDSLTITWNGTPYAFDQSQGIGGYQAAAYVVHTYDAGDYLYLYQRGEDDNEYISVYSLMEEPSYIGSQTGDFRFEHWDDEAQALTGYCMTNPGDFKIRSREWTVGGFYVTGDYAVGWNGMPYQKDYSLKYDSNGMTIKARQDIPVEIVEENGNLIKEDEVLKKGETVEPWKINDWGILIVKTADDTFLRIRLDKDEEGGYTLLGKDPWEVFDVPVPVG